jgi:hypothetical protein
MQEREKILSGKKEKKRALAARTVYVSLDRADAIIEGAPYAALACGVFDFPHFPHVPRKLIRTTR